MGILDEVVAFDFDQAAAWILRRGDDRRQIDLAKLQAGLMWGGTATNDEDADAGKTVDLQARANAFFG